MREDADADQLGVRREPVDLGHSCWQNVSTDGSRLTTDTDRRIVADRFRLMQLLENLFRNAVDHNDGGVAVTVGTLDDGFYIAADGCGIPEEKRDRVFDTGYTTASEGTGFGLEIVLQVVDSHDWEVSITDSATGGLRVEITDVEFETTGSA